MGHGRMSKKPRLQQKKTRVKETNELKRPLRMPEDEEITRRLISKANLKMDRHEAEQEPSALDARPGIVPWPTGQSDKDPKDLAESKTGIDTDNSDFDRRGGRPGQEIKKRTVILTIDSEESDKDLARRIAKALRGAGYKGVKVKPTEDMSISAIALAAVEFTEGASGKLKTATQTIKPPLPELTPAQIKAVIARGKARPWKDHKKEYRGRVFDFVRDTYGQWIPGLLQSHLKLADQIDLYNTFSKAVERKGLPEWLDVPSAAEAHMRRLSPVERAELAVTRKWEARRMRISRNL